MALGESPVPHPYARRDSRAWREGSGQQSLSQASTNDQGRGPDCPVARQPADDGDRYRGNGATHLSERCAIGLYGNRGQCAPARAGTPRPRTGHPPGRKAPQPTHQERSAGHCPFEGTSFGNTRTDRLGQYLCQAVHRERPGAWPASRGLRCETRSVPARRVNR